MRYKDLVDAIETRSRLGIASLRHRFERVRRHAYPLAILLAGLLAAAVCLTLARSPTTTKALAAGGGVGFFLWISEELSFAVGQTGAVSPWLSGHASPLLIGVAGAMIVRRLYRH